MEIDKIINSLSLREKIAQMFIMGFQGCDPDNDDVNIRKAIRLGISGIILFANNVNSSEQLAVINKKLLESARIPLFISIDQEGGLVERLINSDKKVDYLTPMALANTGSVENVAIHTQIMADELKNLNINMNFAPVLDVNTNANNPIIGIRSFSGNTDDVIKYSEPVYKVLNKNNIIAVGKHFPGHGEAWIDSHLDLPEIKLNLEELEKIHIKPFKTAIENGLDAIMVAHVHYTAFDNDKILPASLSGNVINNYLIEKLGFDGLIITDDMDMGGIINHYNHFDAVIKAINAGVDLFIFRDSTQDNLDLVDNLVKAVESGLIQENRVDEAVRKILFYKKKYNILDKRDTSEHLEIFDYAESQEKVDKIALQSIKVLKSGNLLPLDSSKNILILTPDKSEIFNYSKDSGKLSEFLAGYQCEEISYSLNPDIDEINKLQYAVKSRDFVIFVSYNAGFNKGQIDLFNAIDKPAIAIAAGTPYDIQYFSGCDSVIQSFCYKTPSVKAVSDILKNR